MARFVSEDLAVSVSSRRLFRFLRRQPQILLIRAFSQDIPRIEVKDSFEKFVERFQCLEWRTGAPDLLNTNQALNKRLQERLMRAVAIRQPQDINHHNKILSNLKLVETEGFSDAQISRGLEILILPGQLIKDTMQEVEEKGTLGLNWRQDEMALSKLLYLIEKSQGFPHKTLPSRKGWIARKAKEVTLTGAFKSQMCSVCGECFKNKKTKAFT